MQNQQCGLESDYLQQHPRGSANGRVPRSGTFFFNVINFDDSSVLNFTSGTFINLPYTVR
jgi:hypothetical protein